MNYECIVWTHASYASVTKFIIHNLAAHLHALNVKAERA